ncbi:hypothetical protein BRADI_1g13550v3 [Brachypodium distachyon]|uniref:DUF1618 domain-containing protein n=2 Tax=Brachypodium distachyon TaxID=15368 RepID=A0A0Q3NB00_BRADI|nr:hypothetical protein BRADI_1g13550v3 [Brachypodium distachyon]
MPLLRLSAAVSGGLRRSLATVASHPPWGMMTRIVEADPGTQSAHVRLARPPHASDLRVPLHLVKTAPIPGPYSDLDQAVIGEVCASSGDGLLFLLYSNLRVVKEGAAGRLSFTHPRRRIGKFDLTRYLDITRFVLNPLTHQLSRLPDIAYDRKLVYGRYMGLLTQADRGHGPPDRFAIAVPEEGNLNVMLRFLSERDEWEHVAVSPCQLPSAREMVINQETLAFGGRMWFVDVTWGVVSADPFSDRPELSFTELPRGSVLPDGVQQFEGVPSSQRPDNFRQVGVSQGRLRYVEVSRKEPFVLSSFVLDNEGIGWTLEHRVALSKLWADGGFPWLPLKESPQIGLIDPHNANVVYLTVDQLVLVLDMNMKEVTGPYPHTGNPMFKCIPCVLPPWLGSSRIPSVGKKDAEKNKGLADVLVRSDIP